MARQHPSLLPGASEADIQRVLDAELDGRAREAEAEGRAQTIRERSRAGVRQIEIRLGDRIAQVHHRCARRLKTELEQLARDELEAEARHCDLPDPHAGRELAAQVARLLLDLDELEDR